MGDAGQQDRPPYEQEGSLAMYIWYLTENFPATFNNVHKGKLFTDDLPSDAYAGESTETTIDPSNPWAWMLDSTVAGNYRVVQALYKHAAGRNDDTLEELCLELESLILDSSPPYRKELQETNRGNFTYYAACIAFIHLDRCLKENKDIRFNAACDLELITFTIAFAINFAQWQFPQGNQFLTYDGERFNFNEMILAASILGEPFKGDRLRALSEMEQHALMLTALGLKGEDRRIALSNLMAEDLSLDASGDSYNRGERKLKPYLMWLRENHLM